MENLQNTSVENTDNTNIVENNSNTEQQENKNDFLDFVPEEYKNKKYFENIKTKEAFFKNYDDMQKFVGKKIENTIPDFNTATDEEISKFYEKVGVKDIKEYGFEKCDSDFDKSMLEVFKNNGISKKQAQSIFEAFNKNINAIKEQQIRDQQVMTDKTGLGFDLAKELNLDEISIKKYVNNSLNKYIKDKAEQNIINSMSREQFRVMSKVILNIIKDYDFQADDESIRISRQATSDGKITEYKKLVGEYYNTNTNYDRKKEIKKLIDNFKWN